METKAKTEFVQDKPKRMEILVENIPQELIAERKWVDWQWVWENKGWTKPPLDPKTFEIASTDKSDTWGDFQTALARFKNHDADGVGYVITKEGPYTGVDFDDCRHPDNGDINPEVLEEIKTLDSYTEVSPSYTGLKTLHNGQAQKRKKFLQRVTKRTSSRRYASYPGGLHFRFFLSMLSSRHRPRPSPLDKTSPSPTQDNGLPRSPCCLLGSGDTVRPRQPPLRLALIN